MEKRSSKRKGKSIIRSLLRALAYTCVHVYNSLQSSTHSRTVPGLTSTAGHRSFLSLGCLFLGTRLPKG